MILTGHLRGVKTAPACNIVETALTSLTIHSSDFTGCDIKDSALRESHFVNCAFGSSSITHNTIFASVFEECSFRNTDIQNCDFLETTFLRCDLRNLLVKNCTFDRCTFRDCQTSNKLLEMCRLSECFFENTDLQIETLAENFGIAASGFNGRLRDGLAEGPHKIIAIDQLPNWLRKAHAHPIHKLNVDYFLKGTLLEGSSYLDASLNIQAWLPMFRTAGSFVVVLTQLIDFLIWLYDHEKLPIHTLICFHSMTDALLNALGEEPPQRQALAGIGGIHLSLARVIDPYLALLEELATSLAEDVRLLVEGPGTKAHYRRVLSPFLIRGGVIIKDIKPHNSPWELIFSFSSISPKLLFLALFLATRTKIELSRIRSTVQPHQAETTTAIAHKSLKNPRTTLIEPILSLDFGGSRMARAAPNLRLRAYLPGNLVAELRLDISSKLIAKLRKTVKDLIN
jgi:uncharacterized protein YjbI with pentapeptide repeats